LPSVRSLKTVRLDPILIIPYDPVWAESFETQRIRTTNKWLWLLSPDFLGCFPDRVINVHPTFLPAFPGRHSVEAAVA
jgi:Formyl transferase